MTNTKISPTGDFLQFILGGALACGGAFALMNQVSAGSGWIGRSARHGNWTGFLMPIGTPGMGLLLIPLGIGVCLLFVGGQRRLSQLLIWGSAAALLTGVLNSIRLTLMPITLWQLVLEIVMVAAGAGLMFRSLRNYDEPGRNAPH